MVTQQMRGLSPVHSSRLSKPTTRPVAPSAPDRAEIGSSVGRGVTFATLAGLCLMAGTSLVQAQTAPDLVSQVENQDVQDVTLSDQLTQAAQKHGVSLQFEVRPSGRPPVSITPWHAEKILAEAGSVVVTEVKDNQFDRAAYLTDTTDLVAYLNYMKADMPQTEEEVGAVSLRAFFNLVPNTQMVHPRTQESLSPFTAARMLKAERPLLLRMDGAPERRFGNLRELQREISSEQGPGCTLTDTVGAGTPGVYCLN